MYKIDLPHLRLHGIKAEPVPAPKLLTALRLVNAENLQLTKLTKNDKINIQGPKGRTQTYKVCGADIIMDGDIGLKTIANDYAKTPIALITPYPFGKGLMGNALHYVVYARAVHG